MKLDRSGAMTSLCESQAFLDQFDKVLPLCEKGDAVTVINALHVLNSITQASIAQAKELCKERDFVCSFLLELELALELYISPSRKLGKIDGGLPALYSFSESEVALLANVPSSLTKAKVRRFLDALGVAPSPEFEKRSVAETVAQFLGYQVKPSHPKKVRAERKNISWADQCSSGSGSDSDSDCSYLPNVEDDDSEEECSSTSSSSRPSSIASVKEYSASVEESSDEEAEDEEEDGRVLMASIFLSPAPFHTHIDAYPEHEAPNTSTCCGGAQKRVNIPAGAIRQTRPDPFYKTRMCKNYKTPAGCPYGDSCNFAHGVDDLRAEATLVALSSASASSALTTRPPAVESKTDNKVDALYKTRMCNNYEKMGYCKYGDKCNFAHGGHELRSKKGVNKAQSHQDL